MTEEGNENEHAEFTENELQEIMSLFSEYASPSVKSETNNKQEQPPTSIGSKRERPHTESEEIQNNEQLALIMTFFKRSQDALNAGDFALLKRTYEECCEENLIMEVPAVPRITGRDNVLQYSRMVLESMPDLVLVYRSYKRLNRVLTAKMYADGTFICAQPNRYNPFSAPYRDPLISEETYAKYRQLEAAGKTKLLCVLYNMCVLCDILFTV